MVVDMVAETGTEEERAVDYRDYIQALEKERKKIQVFQRELPLSLHLVSQAIESCRQRMAAEGSLSEIDEGETSSEGGPVLEEFIPIKKKTSSQGDLEQTVNGSHEEEDSFSTTKPKLDWLQSVQLWSPNPNSRHEEFEDTCRQSFEADRCKGGSAFHPFFPCKTSPPATTGEAAAPPPKVKSTAASGEEDVKDSHAHRKARRCWSHDLHQRFLDALHQLGGSHVATPKQIRDLMKVEGLTNDEVKSHLQKYRLHCRRPSHGGAASVPPQQVVFLGGLWMPPQEYAVAAAAAAAAIAHPPQTERLNGPQIFAPVAHLPVSAHKQRSNSPSTSSSSHTTSASHFKREKDMQSC